MINYNVRLNLHKLEKIRLLSKLLKWLVYMSLFQMVISLDAGILPSSASRMVTLTQLFPIKMLHMSILRIPVSVHVMVTTLVMVK